MQGLNATVSKEIKRFILSLSDNPFDEGDFPESDETGRPTYCKIINDQALSYFSDHAVQEIKVFELIKANK